jgi:multimeric flavodoxin WrbA
MSKKVLVITFSQRKGSNSDALAAEFARGAKDAGNNVEVISLKEKNIQFCKGCLACQQTKRCVIQDDASLIEEKMEHADVLVFATPIYYYEMSGQMKTMLDRGNPLFTTEYAFRDVYLIATAADEEYSACQGAENGLRGWISCFPKAKLAGTVFGGGVTIENDIRGKKVLEEAYQTGKKV